MADARKSDPDKRALFLAGNRRGVTVPLKEPAPDKTWRTRHVNAFCPRLFSTTRLPDPILASRTIIVPLISTDNKVRARIDPMDPKVWPCSRRELIDNLWALALSGLPELPAWDAWAGEHARLLSRPLQPWRAILSVAAWLEHHGAVRLWQRMEALSMAYQQERLELEGSDFTVLLVRALISCAVTCERSHRMKRLPVPNRGDLDTNMQRFTPPDLPDSC